MDHIVLLFSWPHQEIWIPFLLLKSQVRFQVEGDLLAMEGWIAHGRCRTTQPPPLGIQEKGWRVWSSYCKRKKYLKVHTISFSVRLNEDDYRNSPSRRQSNADFLRLLSRYEFLRIRALDHKFLEFQQECRHVAMLELLKLRHQAKIEVNSVREKIQLVEQMFAQHVFCPTIICLTIATPIGSWPQVRSIQKVAYWVNGTKRNLIISCSRMSTKANRSFFICVLGLTG